MKFRAKLDRTTIPKDLEEEVCFERCAKGAKIMITLGNIVVHPLIFFQMK